MPNEALNHTMDNSYTHKFITKASEVYANFVKFKFKAEWHTKLDRGKLRDLFTYRRARPKDSEGIRD